ncbi:MAG TPA: sugar phosphate nucleotidyltransferase [Gemmatimonadota bacterium]|nr:sugar phosphate nucleotidyltransferase [Gemmatimonadota bacterium]
MTTGDRPRCLIPAAGRGTRLAPVTSIVPKELLPVGTRPMLQWCLTEALEAGFLDIAVVTRDDKPLVGDWVRSGTWTEGLLERVRPAAERAGVTLVHQVRQAGVVNAVFSAAAWIEEGASFAVLLPDNVRIAGPPPLTAAHVSEAAGGAVVLAACHRVGPETAAFFGNVGRAELDERAPAGSRPIVTGIQARGTGPFRAAPEGSWRLAPRYTVTEAWVRIAREVAAEAASRDVQADDVDVHRRLVSGGILRAVPWEGTLVDAGHPTGYLRAQHLLYAAEERAREEAEGGAGNEPLIGIEVPTREEPPWRS